MIEEILLTKLVEASFSKLKKQLATLKKELVSHSYDIQNAISQHLKIVENWSSQITFRDLRDPKEISNTYIDLNLILTPRRLKMSELCSESKSFKDIFQIEESHIVILGQPGAGKTTTMKQISQELLHFEDSVFSKYNFPIIIRLRELSNYRNIDNPLIKKLFNELVLSIDFDGKDNKTLIDHTIEMSTSIFLDSLGVILILDGFDEIQDHSLKRGVIEDIRKLALSLTNSKIILTSRTADYNIKIDNTNEYELDSLSDDQIKLFVFRWLKNQESADRLISLLQKSPFYDTTIRPLTLAHLCAIYERDGQIPERPKSVYKKIINLLLEEWNSQKSVVKNSRYSNFEVDRKFEFLSHLAYFLTVEFGKTNFTKDELARCYELICSNFGLPSKELRMVVDELESHNGLFLQAGYDSYEFAHKSLQEYLTAEYIIRLPNIPKERNILFSLPNELAIAIALSSDATTYFITLFYDRLSHGLDSLDFIHIFISRISIELPNFKTDMRLGMAVLYLFTIYTDKYADISKEEYSSFLESFKKLLLFEPIHNSIRQLVIIKKYEAESKYTYNINFAQYEFDKDYFDKQNNIRFIRKPAENESDKSSDDPKYVYYNSRIME